MRTLFLLLLISAISCTDESGTVNKLQKMGYVNIKIVGPGSPFDCWDEDEVVTEFIAEKNGVKWTGTTCCDLFACSVNKVKRLVPKKVL
jgi:hypothetical protein